MGSWVRYIQNKDKKTIELMNRSYVFPRKKWIYINYSQLLKELYGYPNVFEIADFDIGMIEGIRGIRCHGKIIYTANAEAAEELKKRLWFTYKCATDTHSIFYVSMADFKFRLLELLEKSKSGTVGVYRMKGGWGDVVMAHSIAYSLQIKYPRLRVVFSCPGNFERLVNPDVHVEWMEIHEFLRAEFDARIDLTSPCIRYERTFQPKVKLNRPEIFAQECMLPISDIKPHATVVPSALKWAEMYLERLPRPWIGFVPNSCAPIRDWWGWDSVAKHCLDTYRGTNLIFSAGDVPWGNENGNTPVIGEPMDRVNALLSLCDIVAGVDTGPMHSAAAMGKPTVWVFTHIDGAVRTKGYAGAVVVQDKESCPRCPCWYSSPCSDGRQSPCGEAVEVQHVTTEIDMIWKHTALTAT